MPEPPEKIRSFIAIPLAPVIVEGLSRFQKQLEKSLPEQAIRWTPSEQMHLTLKFLGNVEGAAVEQLKSALEPLGRDFAPLHLKAEGLGGFPSTRNPRVLWVGLHGDLEPLKTLQQKVEQVTEPWAEKEDRRFHPHLTLGRVRENFLRKARQIGEVLQTTTAPPFGEWVVRHFYLMRSQLSPKGATHSVVAEYPEEDKSSQ